MKKLVFAVAFAMLAVSPAKAAMYDGTAPQNSASSATDTQDATQQSMRNSSSQDMDTTLTQQPGVLEEQNRNSTLNHTVDQPASATNNNPESYYFPSSQRNRIQSGTTQSADTTASQNSNTAVAPRGIDGRGAWNVNLGPALTLGLDSDQVLYGVGGGYTFNLTPALGARVFADANFAGGSDSSQYLDVGAAAKIGMGDLIGAQTSKAYLVGDVALANARNASTQHSGSGPAVGAGVGYNIIRTQRTDVDVLLHYALLLKNIDGASPSLLTARLGVNF